MLKPYIFIVLSAIVLLTIYISMDISKDDSHRIEEDIKKNGVIPDKIRLIMRDGSAFTTTAQPTKNTPPFLLSDKKSKDKKEKILKLLNEQIGNKERILINKKLTGRTNSFISNKNNNAYVTSGDNKNYFEVAVLVKDYDGKAIVVHIDTPMEILEKIND